MQVLVRSIVVPALTMSLGSKLNRTPGNSAGSFFRSVSFSAAE